MNAVINIVPDLQVGLGRGRDVERVQHRLIEALFVIGKRRFVDRFQIIGRNDGVFAHIAKQRDFFAFLVGDRVFGSADQNIGCDADGLQFLDRVLRRFGFQFTGRRKVGQQCQVHKNTFAAWLVVAELADRLKKRQAFDIAHGAADFAQHKIDLVFANMQEVFDFVGYMRDDLNGLAEIIAAAFFFQHVGIDPPRRDGIRIACWHTRKAFVVAKVQIGFCAVIGDEDLAVLKR